MSTKFLRKTVSAVSSVAIAASLFAVPLVSQAALGGLYNDGTGTVFFHDISGKKMPFTSGGAFLSYGFGFGEVQSMPSDVSSLPTGSFIPPRDGSIFCATATKGSDVSGECSLITGGMKAAFTSSAVFTGLGFSFANADYGDSSFLTKTSNIDNASEQHRAGVLVNNGGTVQMIVNGGLWGIPSLEVFNSWRYSFSDVVPANTADKTLTQIGVIPSRQAGQLNPTGTTGSQPPVGAGDCVNDGSEGSVDSYNLGSPEDTEALEGQDDVEIYSADVELSDDGDLCLDRVDVWFSQTATASDDPWDYFTDVSLLVNGEVVATENADSSSDWSDEETGHIAVAATDNEFRMRFSGLDAGLASDETSTVSVAVSVVNTLDTADQDAVWAVEIDDASGFRYTDGTGFVFTEGAGAAVLEDTFAMGAEETAAIDLSLSSDSPDSSVIEVDEASDTNDTLLGTYNVEETEGVDVTIGTVTVGITIVDPAGGVDPAGAGTVAKTVSLVVDGDSIGTETVPATADAETVTFDNLDWDLSGDSDSDVEVQVDLDDTNDGLRYDEGTTIKVASFAITEIDDENGNDEGDITTLTTPGAADTHELRTAGIMVDFVDSDSTRTFTADSTGEEDQGTFTIEFDVTAFGDDMYVDKGSEVGLTNSTGTYTLADAAVLAAETYTATINGTAVVYTATAGDAAGTNAQDTVNIMIGLAAAIDANATVGPLVNAYAMDTAAGSSIVLEAVATGSTGNYTTTASDTSVGGTLVAGAAAMASDDVAGQGVEFFTTSNTGTPTLNSDLLESDTTESEDTTDTFFVEEGTTRHFTLTVVYSADNIPTPGSAQVFLKSINWDPDAADTTPDNFYIFDLGDFKTPALFLSGVA